jgi:uncharacterized glyoxalase superfamily protein PhnB
MLKCRLMLGVQAAHRATVVPKRRRLYEQSEFVTGETTLALHPASDKNPAGTNELGFTVADVEAFYRDMSTKGVVFSMPPKKQDFGGVLAQFVDSEGAHCSVGAEAA